MKIIQGLVIVIVAVSCSGKKHATSDEVKLENDTDSISYYTGIYTAVTVKSMELNRLNNEMFLAGIREGLTNEKSTVSKADANYNIKWFFEKQATSQAQKNLNEGNAFLEKNKSRKGVITTASGLQYEIIKPGTGIKPHKNDSLLVHFKGTLIDGTEFISSAKDTPETFSLNQQDEMKGWLESLQLMDIGSVYKFYIPAELGFGNIPPPLKGLKPNAVLIFEIELISILPAKGR